MKRRIQAKNFIVKTWRQVKLVRVMEKLLKKRKEEASVLIQRYLKGYLGRNQAMSKFLMSRFDKNIAFFDEKRHQILVDLQIKVKKLWYAYKERKAKPEN